MTWTQASSASNVSYSAWLANEVVANLARRDDPEAGSAGVREPRRPIQPVNTTGAALPLPHSEDVAARSVRLSG